MNLNPRRLLKRSSSDKTGWLFDEGADQPRAALLGLLLRAVFAVLLGATLWVYVTSQENPETTTPYPNITIQLRNVAPNLKVNSSSSNATIRVSAPQSVLSKITGSDIHPIVDMAGLGAGTHILKINVETPPGVTVQNVDPLNVQVQATLQANKVISLTARTEGTAQIGYNIQPLQVETNTVAVSGPAEVVAQVATAEVVVDVNGKSATVQGRVQPTALDSQGRTVSGVSFQPEAVAITATISLGINYKTVPLKSVVLGEPASGYQVDEIRIEPNTATILGDPLVMSKINFLETEPLDITGRESSIITQQRLVLTTGVSLLNMENSVQVGVTIRAVQSSQDLPVIPTVTNLVAGYSVQVDTRQINLKLQGSLRSLQALDPSTVRATLDLSGLGGGIHQVRPTILLPPGINLQAASPEQVQVTLSLLPSPTVRPSPSVTLGLPSPSASSPPSPSASSPPFGSSPLSNTSPAPSASPVLSPSAPTPNATSEPAPSPSATLPLRPFSVPPASATATPLVP